MDIFKKPFFILKLSLPKDDNKINYIFYETNIIYDVKIKYI
jgi:hypothetical protein